MLSAEILPDPSCSSSKVSSLKTDERASDKLVLKEADLFKSALHDDHTQLPNFSIRNYVGTARRKDVQTNWPFPQQHLQLCLKHGVKDLLPPFEPPDLIRNQCFRKGVGFKQLLSPVDSSSVQSVLGFHSEARYPSQKQDNVAVLGPTDAHLCRSVRSLSSSDRARVEEEFPSSIVNHVQSEGESVPTNTLPCSALDASNSSRTLLEHEVAGTPRASCKTDNTIQTPGKKCRLIVKLGTNSDPSRTEDITSNTTSLSEPMASKVCPVCKTFLSTSNTTLNAHIDQCLAVESISKENMISKLTRHRVKPRKIRSMVDICATAPRCTLEELDRRNGSNWATDASLSTNHVELSAEGKRQMVLPVDIEDNVDKSAVYIDSNGTKLRILSKFNDVSLPTMAREDTRTRKRMKSKDSNIHSTIKKKRLARKHSKHSKLKPHCKKLCYLNSDRAEICEAQKGNYGIVEDCELEESLSKILQVHEQTRPSVSGTLRPWGCSRHMESVEVNGEDDRQGQGNPLPVMRDRLTEDNRSYLGDSSLGRSRIPNSQNLTENPFSSTKRRKVGSTVWGDEITGTGEKYPKLPERNLNQAREITTSLRDTCMLKLTKSSGSPASSLRRKRVEIRAGPVGKSENFPKVSKNPSNGRHLLSKEKKPSSVRKKMLLVVSSSPKTKFNEKERSSVFQKSRVHSISEIGEQTEAVPSEVDELYDEMYYIPKNQSGCVNQVERTHKSDCSNNIFRSEAEEITDELALGRIIALESYQERESVIQEREDSVTFEASQPGPRFCGLDHAATILSSAGDRNVLIDKSVSLESSAKEVPLRKVIGGAILRSHANLVSEFHKLPNPLGTKPNSFLSIEEQKESLCGTKAPIQPTDQSSLDDEGIFCTDEVDNGVLRQNICITAEMDGNHESGNSFSEVDTIPIPGPPGSFLPSPRDMESEVLQENSSLTSSRAQSPQDQLMLADRESTGSPVSATSAISHLPTARSEMKYSEPQPSVEPHSVQDMIRSSFPDGGIKSLIGDSTGFPCRTSIEVERINLNRENLKPAVTSPAKLANDQSCCCSQKGLSQCAAFEESLRLKKHSIASLTLPAKGKLIGCFPNIKPEIFTSFSTYPCLRTDKDVIPVLKLPTGSISMKDSLGAATKFPSHVDYDCATPSSQSRHPQSSSSPVLRLMGKNLMVVNKEEDASMQPRSAQPGALSAHSNLHYSALHGLPYGSNQDHTSFHHTVRESSAIPALDPPIPLVQYFDVRFSNSFRSHGNSRAHITPTQSSGNRPVMQMGGFSSVSLEQHGFEDRISFRVQPRPDGRQNASYVYNLERVAATTQLRHQNSISTNQAAANPIQEVIIIGDSPENEADSIMMNTKYISRLMGSQASPSQTATNSNSRQVNAFSCSHPQNPFSLTEPPPVGPKHSSFIAPSQGGAHASPVRWGSATQGSSVLVQRPFMVSPSPTAHRSAAVHYSPSLS